jgi:cell division protein FtsI (penicillin-binding protein 3)
VTPRTPLTVPDNIRSSDRVIRDYFDHGTTPYTMTGVVAKSSNVGTLLAARRLPARVLHHYLTEFGLGSRTGLPDGYGESAGLLSPWQDWIQVERDNIAFGQGLAVNAVQMAAAVNTIANGGEYVEPSIIEGRATPDFGPATGSDLAHRHRVVSARTATQMAHMMEMVTTEGAGTAPGAKVPGYRTAGKTGTAQIADPACGCYNGRLFTVSFAGFAPADDPRFTVYVVVHHPKGEGGGGTIAGPAFRKIMSFLLQKYAVPPTDTPPADLPITWDPTRADLRRGVERVPEEPVG